MTVVTRTGNDTMRITRDIQDKGVAEWLRTVPESMLAAFKAEAEADEELAAAIRYSLEHDDPADNLTADEFLAAVKHS